MEREAAKSSTQENFQRSLCLTDLILELALVWAGG